MSDFNVPMNVGQMSPATAGLIIEDVVATVLDITMAAWAHLCQGNQVGPTDKEKDVADQLRWKMVAEKNRRDPRPQLRFEREVERDDPEKEYSTGRIDIFVIYSFDEMEFFVLECKKVTDRHKTLANKYITEGVCRFSSGKYSAGHPYGAMVAFVSDGTAEAAAGFLGRRMVAFDENATRIKTAWGWRMETRFGDIPNLYSTEHGQEGTRSTILLLHLFLPFPIQN